ncbi:MAG: DUF1302 family protein [Paucibacter sp.]|nr:DUF1302 family protein [Roseateles sp.]
MVGKTGGLGASNFDGGDLNCNKGDSFSQVLKFVTELSLSKDSSGVFVRVKGWDDEAQGSGEVPFGNQANGYKTGIALDLLARSGASTAEIAARLGFIEPCAIY